MTVVEAADLAEGRLRDLGFALDRDGLAVACRWSHPEWGALGVPSALWHGAVVVLTERAGLTDEVWRLH